jgi:hypothetical protein
VLASSSSSSSSLSSLQQQPDHQQQPELRYDEFVGLVREVMARKLGTAAFTVQLGHILDRVAASALEKRGKSLVAGDDTMPILFWFTLLSLALSSPPKDRIDALYAVLSSEHNNDQGEKTTPAAAGGGVTLSAVTELVGYLQDTCQLVPDAQVMATTHQYPLQQYDIASPVQLVDRYRVQHHKNKDKEQTTTEEDHLDNMVDKEQLWDMLTSNSICVWGECYKKKKRRQG